MLANVNLVMANVNLILKILFKEIFFQNDQRSERQINVGINSKTNTIRIE